MIGDGILDHLEQFFRRIDRPDGQLVKQLHHKTCESLESSRYADGRRHFDKHTFGSMDVDLQSPGLIDG